MWKLRRPPHAADAVFTTCISRVKNGALKARLQGVTQAVADASEAFDAAASATRLHEIAQHGLVGGTVTAAEMEAVYRFRMARKEGPGRKIYDELISAPAHGRCPLCGQRSVSTLDHHLPKLRYPALAVAPLNLVPACFDCNKLKLEYVPRRAVDETLHPYFDDIDAHQWLGAEVVESRPAAVRFFVVHPAEWSEILRGRVENHFKTLGLHPLYAAQAAEEITNIRHQLRDIRALTGADGVRAELNARADSCRRARSNGWRTAAYRAFATSEWFCDGGFLADAE